MKLVSNKITGLVFLFGFLLIVLAHRSPLGIGEIAGALKSGNAANVAKFFDEKVDISIAGKSVKYSKAQAAGVLQTFFATNTVRNFTIKHQGDQAGSEFCIGTLSTSSGDFRTTFYLSKREGSQNLQEIRFE